MTDYTPVDSFDTVQTYDESDLVKGGIDGKSCLPIEQLADRTQYLFNRLGGYLDVKDVTASGAITPVDANKLISVVAGANITLTLDAVGTFKKGARIAIVANLTGAGPFFVNVVTGQDIYNGSETSTNIWMYDGEMIELVAGATIWLWTIAKGNFDKIGEMDLRRFQPKNSFLADGTANQSRAIYPRIWAKVLTGAVSDINWTTSGNRYKQQFSTGNGTTTFRRPDYRGMFLRALDSGRGISLARLDAVAGGFEQDAVKDHFHNSGIKSNSMDYVDGTATPNNIGNAATGTNIKTGGVLDSLGNAAGATETRGINAGFYPYIYY